MSMQNELASLNRAVALDRVGGDVGLLHEIAGLFLEEYPKLLGDIRKAIAASEPQKLERAAHSLKGSVGNFGAAPAFQAALSLEMLGRQGELDKAPAALAQLENALKQLEPELAALISSMP